MLERRLQTVDRTPSAVPFAIGHVAGRRLRFHKVSIDGSGKFDAESTGNLSDRVYGVVFEVLAREMAALNRAEGVGWGYEVQIVSVATEARVVEAMTYVATRKNPALRPYHWYKALTVAGAVDHGLPMDYIESLRSIESIADPDDGRRAMNEALLIERRASAKSAATRRRWPG